MFCSGIAGRWEHERVYNLISENCELPRRAATFPAFPMASAVFSTWLCKLGDDHYGKIFNRRVNSGKTMLV